MQLNAGKPAHPDTGSRACTSLEIAAKDSRQLQRSLLRKMVTVVIQQITFPHQRTPGAGTQGRLKPQNRQIGKPGAQERLEYLWVRVIIAPREAILTLPCYAEPALTDKMVAQGFPELATDFRDVLYQHHSPLGQGRQRARQTAAKYRPVFHR